MPVCSARDLDLVRVAAELGTQDHNGTNNEERSEPHSPQLRRAASAAGMNGHNVSGRTKSARIVNETDFEMPPKRTSISFGATESLEY